MNQNGKFGLLMSSVVSFGICVWFAMLLRRFETEWISVIRIEVLSCTRSLAQLIVGKKQLRNTHTHVDEKQFIYIKRLVELVTLHIALQASLGVWLARGNGHASHAPCIATFGKTLACKHWKIQNSYFAISLSFFCIILFRLVVLNLCCHLCWHFFDIFFFVFFLFFLSFGLSFVGHFSCYFTCEIARNVFVPVLLACQRSAGSALLPPIAANLRRCFTTTSMHSCHVSTHSLDYVGSALFLLAARVVTMLWSLALRG